MKQKTAAIITSKGMGDGLMMMVAAHRLALEGYQVTTYHNRLFELRDWFLMHQFHKEPKSYEEELKSYDLIVLQNDNTPKSQQIRELFQKGSLESLSIFYASHEKIKHPPLTSWDQAFESQKPMVENIAKAIARVLQTKQISKNNGIVPPTNLVHRKYKNRVIIHPEATIDERTYSAEKFLEIAALLKLEGFNPVFSISPQNLAKWKKMIEKDSFLPSFPTLNELAAYIYESGYLIGNESGPSHLASNLQIPTLVIAGNKKRMRLWRPGWLQGEVITPPSFIPNFKYSRLREKKWQRFISPTKVIRLFKKLAAKN
ncbi:MAG: hypothetical protein KAR79_00115 [Simkaniaceae bacterium]|nr:hypothetical protein [Simkaniaceae bacterium]